MGIVYEAHDRQHDARVALKTLRQLHPQAILRFKHEFRSLTEITHPNLVPLYELVAEGDHWFFTMELLEGAVDFFDYVRPPDRSLQSAPPLGNSQWNRTTRWQHENTDTWKIGGPPRVQPVPNPLDLPRLREALRQLVNGTHALHQAGKLHRDVKPSNVLVRPDDRLVLVDFGLVAELREDSSARLASEKSDFAVGTAAYMAPEQAAGRSLTPASDWYAVGVMLFQSLTGSLPYAGTPRELLRAKQLMDAPCPTQFADGLPGDLVLLCRDLLQRDPTLRPDGAELQHRLMGRPSTPPLPTDIPPSIPFVGRETHLAELAQAYEIMRSGKTVVYHVHGTSGVGKSALLQTFLDRLDQIGQAVVLRGRCYERESVPYKGADSLVDSLIHYLLHLPRTELPRLLPDDMSDLRRIFPVFGDLPEDPPSDTGSGLDLREQRRRAFATLRQLLEALARQRPLVLYIDDLQWGDRESADLLSALLHPPAPPPFLLLISYRSEYRNSSPCLRALTTPEAEDEPRIVRGELQVGPLSPEETRRLASALLGGVAGTESGAQWIVNESGGSPLFVYTLARSAMSGAVLQSGEVHLDEVLWQHVQQLPDDARRLLEVVAVAGRPLPLCTLQQAARLPSLPPDLLLALHHSHLIRSTGPGLDDELETYHDRIRESVVAHLATAPMREHHRQLAVTLEGTGDAAPEGIADHFFGAEEWERAGHYYTLAADRAIAVLAFEQAERFYQRAAELTQARDDKARIHEKMIHFYTDLARFREAYEIGRRALRLYNVRVPARFVAPLFLFDVWRARYRLRGRTIAGIAQLPTLKDPQRTEAVRLMAAMGKAAYQIRPELCIALLVKIVNTCLRHGNTPDCAIGYMAFGTIFLGGIRGDHRIGFEFGKLSLDLVERYENDQLRAEVQFVVGYFGTSWLRPATEAEALWREAYHAGLASHDFFHTGCASAATVLSMYLRGAPLEEVEQAAEQHEPFLARAQLREPAGCLLAVRQAIRNLRGQTAGATSWDDATFDEAAFARQVNDYGSRHFAHYYYVLKLHTLYHWGQYVEALRLTEASSRYLRDSAGMLHGSEHLWIHALVLAALSGSAGPWQRRRWLRDVRRTLGQFAHHARNCPHNFLAKERLLAGELYRVTGRHREAIEAYDASLAAAATYGQRHVGALANRLAFRLCCQTSRSEMGRLYRDAAQHGFRSWGATDRLAEVDV